MSLRKLTPGKAIALGLLTLAAVALWKVGASSAPVASYTAPGKGKACCDKPMNRAALIRQAAATPSQPPTEPSTPTPAP